MVAVVVTPSDSNNMIAWLIPCAHELLARKLLPISNVAAILGKDAEYVQEQRAKKALYARAFYPEYVAEATKGIRPDEAEAVKPLVEFIKAGNTLAFPAWQIKADGTIRPEVARAAVAYTKFATEANSQGADYPMAVREGELSSLFSGTGGFGKGVLSEMIAKNPNRTMSTNRLVNAWWYHKNPYGDFF